MYTKKFYVHEIAAVYLSKIYFLKNPKKTCKTNNRAINRDWNITPVTMISDNNKARVLNTLFKVKLFALVELLVALLKLNFPYAFFSG